MKGTVYIPISDDGTLESIAKPDRIPDIDIIFIHRIIQELCRVFINKKIAIYLRGSLAYGSFIEGISDLDMVVFSDSFCPEERRLASQIAGSFSRKFNERYSLVDISCVEAKLLRDPSWNRLYLNIALTGIQLYNNGLDLHIPQPSYSTDLCLRIADQTIKDCTQTLDDLLAGGLHDYMGQLRGTDFLFVWFARDYIRGLIAFVMEKRRVFSLHLETCAYEFSCCFPQYREITEQIFRFERKPDEDQQTLERLASDALALYSELFDGRKEKWMNKL